MQSSEDEEDFEIVPQEPDDADAEMWDVEGENEDEIKQAHINSRSLPAVTSLRVTHSLCRAWYHHA